MHGMFVVQIAGIIGTAVVLAALIITSGKVRQAKEEALGKEVLQELRTELAQIKASLAAVEKMMKDID